MILLLFFVLNYSLIHGAPVADDENGWWDVIASHMPLWYTQEGYSDDNDEEIKNSVKLMELFPTIKQKLDSPDEEEQEEAKEFIKRMNAQIKEKKRYTHMLWNGVKTIIDMGRVESKERRSNEEQVSVFWKFIQGIIDFFKWMCGMKTGDDKKDKEKKGREIEKAKSNKEGESEKSSDNSVKEHGSDEQKQTHDHTNIVPTHHTTPPSDPNARTKDDKDKFEGKAVEVIRADEHSNTIVPTHHTLPLSDPKALTKDELDKFDSSKPMEVIHSKDHSSSEEIKND